MTAWESFVEFVSDPTTWSGPASFWVRIFEHMWVSVAATLIAMVLVFPAALWLGHIRKGSKAASVIVNIGRAIPSFGILAFAVLVFVQIGINILSPWPVVVALVALAAPPIFTNTVVGIQSVRPATIEAARGMGLTERGVLMEIELPLAMPLVMEGIRIAFVQVVATATLGAIVAWGGLGRYIIDGFAQRDTGQIIFGALAVGVLAVGAEFLFSRVESGVTPRGLKIAR